MDKLRNKSLVIIVICILVIVLSVGMISLRRSLPSQSYLNINEPSEQFYTYTNEIDNIHYDEEWCYEYCNNDVWCEHY